MSGIDRDFDLNLLRVFDAVMRHRSVSVASRHLGVTPSAVSHALGRLRRALGDELFVFGDADMRPTQRASELHPAITEGLDHIGRGLNALTFDPARSERCFRISMSDYASAVVLPPLMQALAQDAPHVRLTVFPENRVDVVQHVDSGEVGFAVGWFREIPPRMRRATLFEEREAIVARVGHPLCGTPVTREALLRYPHAVVHLVGGARDRGAERFLTVDGVERRVWIERLLEETAGDALSTDRRAAVTVPHYAALPPLIEAGDMLATLPERLARREVACGRLARLDLPYEPLAVPIEVIWHHRSGSDAGLQWLIAKTQGLFADS